MSSRKGEGVCVIAGRLFHGGLAQKMVRIFPAFPPEARFLCQMATAPSAETGRPCGRAAGGAATPRMRATFLLLPPLPVTALRPACSSLPDRTATATRIDKLTAPVYPRDKHRASPFRHHFRSKPTNLAFEAHVSCAVFHIARLSLTRALSIITTSTQKGRPQASPPPPECRPHWSLPALSWRLRFVRSHIPLNHLTRFPVDSTWSFEAHEMTQQ